MPPLQQTLDRYLLALQPIISEEELNHTQELVAEFCKPGGVGERLQKGLERRAKKTENWVGQATGSGWGECYPHLSSVLAASTGTSVFMASPAVAELCKLLTSI